MKENRKLSTILSFIIKLLPVLVLLIFFLIRIAPRPPIKEFETYRKLVKSSDYGLTDTTYSYENAEFFRTKAFEEWQKQNELLLVKRDYSESKRMIILAISILEEAKKDSMDNTIETDNIANRDSLCENSLYYFEQRIPEYSMHWRKWLSDAITYSKERKTIVLIIDKLNQSCLVVENGNQIAEYSIEMGVNYLCDKNRPGDFATPEGSYYIRGKKSSPKTTFYKELTLNYPNREDSIRIRKAGQNHEIINLDVLSDKICLHGSGGKGYNWTDGSIAFTNEHMDSLFNHTKVGTRVVIVGTTNYIISKMNK